MGAVFQSAINPDKVVWLVHSVSSNFSIDKSTAGEPEVFVLTGPQFEQLRAKGPSSIGQIMPVKGSVILPAMYGDALANLNNWMKKNPSLAATMVIDTAPHEVPATEKQTWRRLTHHPCTFLKTWSSFVGNVDIVDETVEVRCHIGQGGPIFQSQKRVLLIHLQAPKKFTAPKFLSTSVFQTFSLFPKDSIFDLDSQSDGTMVTLDVADGEEVPDEFLEYLNRFNATKGPKVRSPASTSKLGQLRSLHTYFVDDDKVAALKIVLDTEGLRKERIHFGVEKYVAKPRVSLYKFQVSHNDLSIGINSVPAGTVHFAYYYTPGAAMVDCEADVADHIRYVINLWSTNVRVTRWKEGVGETPLCRMRSPKRACSCLDSL